MDRLEQLHDAGQSIWLDFIDRTLLRSGELARRIERDSLTGMTSNPTIFEKALAEGHAYDAQLAGASPELSAWELFELVETDDVRAACDIFRTVHEKSKGTDGFVSIEVSPASAHSVDDTIAEARRLWAVVDRPNVMIKVPGTTEGAAATRRLLADGINVNITLLFSVEAHAAVIESYIAALEERAKRGLPLSAISSVASYFVSRVDTEADKRLDAIVAANPSRAEEAKAFRGRVAVANAKLAYALFQEKFSGARWEALSSRGARVQRPLWASTSAKNPAYRDVVYVEDLIGPDTVNTMPPATITAFADHGVVKRTVDTNLDEERALIAKLEKFGVPLKAITDTLLREGLKSFEKSFDTLIAGLEAKRRTLGAGVAAT
ncbi:MAG TPA: transaldolase [Gemmatimonadaceae bacterium]|jgi:transaldolase|nr:transaldolase [Gemmatimonadaceae bacterium]